MTNLFPSISTLLSKRIIAIFGHYGSGKTEIAVSLAMLTARQTQPYQKCALIDLDIVNPYFRSREQRDMLKKAGIEVYGSVYNTEITAELPALGANARVPLEDKNCLSIVDFGGNDVGAMIMNQFGKYFTTEDALLLGVVNANRPDTRTVEGAVQHIAAIEQSIGKTLDALINNSHLLRETTAQTVIQGHAFVQQVAQACNKKLWADCYPEELVQKKQLTPLLESGSTLLPLGLYMRPTWLDK